MNTDATFLAPAAADVFASGHNLTCVGQPGPLDQLYAVAFPFTWI